MNMSKTRASYAEKAEDDNGLVRFLARQTADREAGGGHASRVLQLDYFKNQRG